MTARQRGGHERAAQTPLHLSTELKAVFKLLERIAGGQGIHGSAAATVLQTASALVSCDFDCKAAAVMLRVSPETMRQRVHRIKERVLVSLRETSYSVPVRPSIEQNLGHWDSRDLDAFGSASLGAEDDES